MTKRIPALRYDEARYEGEGETVEEAVSRALGHAPRRGWYDYDLFLRVIVNDGAVRYHAILR